LDAVDGQPGSGFVHLMLAWQHQLSPIAEHDQREHVLGFHPVDDKAGGFFDLL